MKRLILIGNGFYLAHNLKTSYKDFIEYLWKRIFEELRLKMYGTNQKTMNSFYPDACFEFIDGNKLIKLEYRNNQYLVQDNILHLRLITKRGDIVKSKIELDKNDSNNILLDNLKDQIGILKRIGISYINKFFEIISQSYFNKNWSDIEADYYKELLKVKNNEKDIKELNLQFNQIKELLRDYLKSLPKSSKIDRLETIIYEPIKFDNLRIGYNPSPNSINNIGFFPNNIGSVVKDSITYLNNRFLGSIMFLNFNYTQTEKLYVKKNIQVNHIHGSLNDPNNHMIFGYGNEEAEEYKELEKLDYKGLLDNVKSINYLEASNYRDMERFIESDKFQIFIRGMSCGMADHTMLHKLFQHKNCVSVKPFYYQWKDDKGNVAGDNYIKIVENISRCFSDKDLLRSVVVNKPNCEPLPQWND